MIAYTTKKLRNLITEIEDELLSPIGTDAVTLRMEIARRKQLGERLGILKGQLFQRNHHAISRKGRVPDKPKPTGGKHAD